MHFNKTFTSIYLPSSLALWLNHWRSLVSGRELYCIGWGHKVPTCRDQIVREINITDDKKGHPE